MNPNSVQNEEVALPPSNPIQNQYSHIQSVVKSQYIAKGKINPIDAKSQLDAEIKERMEFENLKVHQKMNHISNAIQINKESEFSRSQAKKVPG